MADAKITALTAATSTDPTDIVPIVTGVGTTPLTQKITVANFLATTCPATSGTDVLKGDGSGGTAAASAGTDFAPATSGTDILTGDGSGGFGSAPASISIGSFGCTVDGGGSALTTGSKGYVTIPYSCTITNWYLVADTSGDCVVDLKRSGASIIGGSGNKPTISGAQRANAAVSSWTSDDVTAGDELEFNIDSATTVTRINLTFKVTKA